MKKYLLFFTFILSFVQAQNKLISGKIMIDGDEELINLEKINILLKTIRKRTLYLNSDKPG